MSHDHKEYQKKYRSTPEFKKKLYEYQKWFYSCTDVGITCRCFGKLNYQLKDAKLEFTRFNILIKIAFAKIDYEKAKNSCSGNKGR